jgi:hypothetical protein
LTQGLLITCQADHRQLVLDILRARFLLGALPSTAARR